MLKQVVFLLFTSTFVLTYAYNHQKTTRCERHNFFNSTSKTCQECSQCGKGFYIKSNCRRYRDTKCKECRNGHFSSTSSWFPGGCRRCKTCGQRPVLKKCTKISDTVCGECPIGSYMDYLSLRCEPCSYCFSDVGYKVPQEEGCQKPEIPKEHRCTRLAFQPYIPPHLKSVVDEEGKKRFISSSRSTEQTETQTQLSTSTKTDSTPILEVNTDTSPNSFTARLKTTTEFDYDIASLQIFFHETYPRMNLVYITAAAAILCVVLVLTAVIVCRLKKGKEKKVYRPIVKKDKTLYAQFKNNKS